MNRNVVVILIVAIVVGGLSLFYLYVRQYTPKYNWGESYHLNDEDPYNLSIFYNLLDKENKINNIKKSFYSQLDTNATHSNYIAFGSHLYIDSLRAKHILKFVEKGNAALIAANNAPLKITRMLLPPSDTIYGYDEQNDSIITVNFENNDKPQGLTFHYQFLKDTMNYRWSVYSKTYFNDTLKQYGFYPISILNNKINCYAFDYGKGKVILYSTPILFSNYNIIQKDGLKNTNVILSHLTDGPIYWDEISQKQNYSFSSNGMPTGNPLQFLFSHYTLRWGWYLFLVTVVLYLLFRTKREQRIIPILPKNTNSTIAYTKAIGVLYFQKGQHKLIANEMHVLLLAELRQRYNINTSIKEPALIDQLVIKSGLEKEFITKLFKQFRKVRYSPMANSKDLINLHNIVEFYYKKCN